MKLRGKVLIVTDPYCPAKWDMTPNDLPFVFESCEEFPAARRELVELRYMRKKGSRLTRRYHKMRVGADVLSLSTEADHWNWFPLSLKHGYDNPRTDFLEEC